MNPAFQQVPADFNPSILSPFYFVRQGLLKAIGQFAPQLNGRLLDFGCGSKPYRSLFATAEYVGVDYENPGHPHTNEQIDVFYDGKNIPFGNDHFDSILCSEVFEHVFNLPDILNELNRVLKPGGKMLVTCPFVWPEHEVPHDFARYSRFALKSLLEQNGFEEIGFVKTGNYWSATSQLRTMYFYELSVRTKWLQVIPFRWIYKFLFYGCINLGAVLCSRLFPQSHTLYLNNVMLVRKKVQA